MRRSTPLDIMKKVKNLIEKASASENKGELDEYMYELMDMYPGNHDWTKMLADFEEEILSIIEARLDEESNTRS